MEEPKRIKDEENNNVIETSTQPATFVVKIICSKNNSVQGYLHWLEREKSVPFRSYMELTDLINEALKSSEFLEFRSWQEDAEYLANDKN